MADCYVDILEPKQNPEESIKLLAQVITPLYHKYWDAQQEKYDGRPFELQAQMFTTLWFTGASKIFVAYERKDNTPIGFLLGMTFRPMLYNAHVFQVEDWYAGGDADVARNLFDFALRALRFIGCDELRAEEPFPQDVISGDWKKTGTFQKVRYTKVE